MPGRTFSTTIWRRSRGFTAACARRRITGSRSMCFVSRAEHRPEVMTKSGFMVGLGRNAGRGRAAAARPSRAGCRCCHDRPISAAHAPQSAGRRICDAGAVRRVSRIRTVAWIQNGIQRPAGAQFLYGGSRQASRPRARDSQLDSGLASAGLLVLLFPRFSFAWLAPVALTPLLIACAREASLALAFRCSGMRPASSIGSAFATGSSGRSRTTRGVSAAVAWFLFVLFCLAKAVQMGVFAALAGLLIRSALALPGDRGALGGYRVDALLHGLRMAEPGQRRKRHDGASPSRADHRRLGAFVCHSR